MRYEQARADFERLVEIHKDKYPYDWIDGFCFEEYAFELMRNPTKAKATQIYREAIRYSAKAGFSTASHDRFGILKYNDEVKEIYHRHGIPTIGSTIKIIEGKQK